MFMHVSGWPAGLLPQLIFLVNFYLYSNFSKLWPVRLMQFVSVSQLVLGSWQVQFHGPAHLFTSCQSLVKRGALSTG